MILKSLRDNSSDGCNDCGKLTLDCICRSRARYILARTCGSGCPCQFKSHYTHLNLVRNRLKDGTDPPDLFPETKWINVQERSEHEAIIKDAAWCKELGLDQTYEIAVYLNRWGRWLRD